MYIVFCAYAMFVCYTKIVRVYLYTHAAATHMHTWSIVYTTDTDTAWTHTTFTTRSVTRHFSAYNRTKLLYFTPVINKITPTLKTITHMSRLFCNIIYIATDGDNIITRFIVMNHQKGLHR